MTAHKAGYPMVIHQNGDQAILDTIIALQNAQNDFPAPDFRDAILHAPLISVATLANVKALNDPISFLMENVYYWGLPFCQQIVGPTMAAQLYPANDAENAGLHVTLHSDTPVSVPDPLFEIWVAKTRNTQQPSWYPNTNASCPTMMSPALGANEAIRSPRGLRRSLRMLHGSMGLKIRSAASQEVCWPIWYFCRLTHSRWRAIRMA